MWEDLEVVELCGPPPFFASSDFIDLNLMKNSVLVTDRSREEGGSVTGGQLPKTEVEERAGQIRR